MARTHTTPEDECLSCHEQIDRASNIGQTAVPRPNDITVCLYCGHVMAFNKKLKVRELTDDEVIEIAGMPELRTASKMIKLFRERKGKK